MQCIGFGEYKGVCSNEAGTPWSTHWCDRCDRLRRDHITRRFKELGTNMPDQKEEGDAPEDS